MGIGQKIISNKQPTLVKFNELVLQIFAGGEASGALTVSNDLYLWGANFNGNLAINHKGIVIDCALLPVLFDYGQISLKDKILYAALGSYHSLFLTNAGDVYSCGLGRSGKLGLGDFQNFENHVNKIKGLENIKKIAVSDGHSIAFNQNEIYTWGEGLNGKLGHGVNNPVDRICEDKVKPMRCEFTEKIQMAGCGNKYTAILDKQFKISTAGNLDKKKVWHEDDFVF